MSPGFEGLIPLHDAFFEAEQENRFSRPQLIAFAGPMRRHTIGAQPGSIAHAFDDAGDKSGAVQLADFLGDADEAVDQGLVVDDHVFILLLRALLERICGAVEEGTPDGAMHELKQLENTGGSSGCSGGLSIEEEVEEFGADGVASAVEAGFDLAH